VQPVDPSPRAMAGSVDGGKAERAANYMACVDFVMKNPDWRISIQSHKVLGIP
jgi:hypothetical protein